MLRDTGHWRKGFRNDYTIGQSGAYLVNVCGLRFVKSFES